MEGMNFHLLAFSAQPTGHWSQDKGQTAGRKKAPPLPSTEPSQGQEPCGYYHGMPVVAGLAAENRTDALVLFFKGYGVG